MDEFLRNLERAAAVGDEAALNTYLRSVLRVPDLYSYIERRARWAEYNTEDQDYVFLYMRLLALKGEVDLENLWACPIYTDYPEIYLEQPIPYALGASFDGLTQILTDHQQGGGLLSAKAFIRYVIVDIQAVEMSDKVLYLAEQRFAMVEADQNWLQVRFIESNAILIVDPDVTFLPLPHQVHITPDRIRETRDYWTNFRKVSNQELTNIFPKRETHTYLLGQRPSRVRSEPYVVTIHMPTFRGFVLGGGYQLLSDNASEELMSWAMRYNRQTEFSYTGGAWPTWATSLPKSEFVSYWIAE